MTTTNVEQVTRIVNGILIAQLGVTENQLTRQADVVVDLKADEEDLSAIDDAIARAFNIEAFDYTWNTWMETDAAIRVGDLIEAVIDVRQHVPAEGPGR